MGLQTCCIHSEAICAAQTALEAELRGLDLQANSLRKEHDRLVQDRLSCTSKLAQLKDSLKVSTCCCCCCCCCTWLSSAAAWTPQGASTYQCTCRTCIATPSLCSQRALGLAWSSSFSRSSQELWLSTTQPRLHVTLLKRPHSSYESIARHMRVRSGRRSARFLHSMCNLAQACLLLLPAVCPYHIRLTVLPCIDRSLALSYTVAVKQQVGMQNRCRGPGC